MFKRVVLAIVIVLAFSVGALAQSTTVSGTVTDAGAQAWTGAAYTFTFVPNPQFPTGPYTWTGGVLNTTIKGVLSGTATYSQSVPSNASISPSGSTWQLQVCPQATSPCFVTSNTTISGGTQTLNATPPAISINLNNPPGPYTSAYADTEIATTPLGGQYYNTTLSSQRQCTVITGGALVGACTTWAASGGGGGTTLTSIPGVPGISTIPVTTGLLAEYRMLSTETPSALVDYSGNSNNATGTTGTAPTIIATTGGVQFNGNGNIQIPTSISALTFIFYACFQNPASSTVANYLIESSTAQTGLGVTTNFPGINTLFGGSRLHTLGGNAIKTQTNFPANGCGVWVETMSATDHIYWNGQEAAFYTATGTSAGGATGVWNLGGNSGSFWQGQVYWADIFSGVLTQPVIQANGNFITQAIINRGGPAPYEGITTAGDMIDTAADSIGGDFGLTTRWQSQVTLTSGLGWITITEPIANNGLPGVSLNAMAKDVPMEVWPMLRIGTAPVTQYFPAASGSSGRNTVIGWGGTNDCSQGASAAAISGSAQAYVAAIKAGIVPNVKMIFATMISRTTLDTCKNNWNTLLRPNAPLWGIDYNVDMASNPLLGADGANANATWFQADSIHWSQASATNFGAFYFQRAVNATYGPNSFSNAATYTAASTAATTITAASSSGFISTITMAANPWVSGQCVVITGVTPAGYNSPAGQCWFILPGATGTTFTFQNSVTGLGAGTVFGTAQAAQELDTDTLFEILGGAAAGPSHIIQTCQGRDFNKVKLVMITNTNASPWTISSLTGETINGGATFTTPVASATNHPVIALKPILTSASAAGCTWQASIQ